VFVIKRRTRATRPSILTKSSDCDHYFLENKTQHFFKMSKAPAVGIDLGTTFGQFGLLELPESNVVS